MVNFLVDVSGYPGMKSVRVDFCTLIFAHDALVYVIEHGEFPLQTFR